jgi:hypothetical protein
MKHVFVHEKTEIEHIIAHMIRRDSTYLYHPRILSTPLFIMPYVSNYHNSRLMNVRRSNSAKSRMSVARIVRMISRGRYGV